MSGAGNTAPIVTATPTFYPEAGTYTSPQKVTISDASSGVTIHYTTDGSVATALSDVYSGPIQVAATTSINAIAIAVADAGSASASASGTFVLDLPVADKPTFSVAPGAYTAAQSLSLLSDVPGAEIRFTTDGSAPTAHSTLYVAPVQISTSTMIRAFTTAYGFQQSAEADASYSIRYSSADAPMFLPAPGTYATSQNVSIVTSIPGAVIYYTSDGSIPTQSSPTLNGTIPVVNEGATTIQAVVTAPNFTPSSVVSATYLLKLPMAPTPTTSPAEGDYTTTQSVLLTDAAPGASVYYTLDGSTPTTASTRYTSPITVATTTEIRAIATAPDFTTSTSSLDRFVFPASAPLFSPAGGVYTSSQLVTLGDSMAGASIFYTLDGSAASDASTLYKGPIEVSTDTTIRAVAVAPNFTVSPASAASYTVYSETPPVTFSPNGGNFNSSRLVTLSDALPGATIFYTLDGSVPNDSSMVYTAPILLSTAGPTTVNAIATYTGLSRSSVSTATFSLVFPLTGPPSYTYKSVQIGGGGFVDGVYFHPAQQGLMYAHTDIGGAYRWNAVPGGDAGWVPLNDSIGRFNNGFDLSVQSLAVDPSDASRLYLAVGAYTESYGANGAVLASSDMGRTFTATALPFKNGGNDSGRNNGDRLVVDPNNGKHLYLGTFLNGLYESLDRGATWTQVSAFPVTGASGNPKDPEAGIIFEQFVAASGTAVNGVTKTVYYGVSSPTKGLYVSQDGGSTFAIVPGQPTGYYPNAEAFDAVNGVLYVTYAADQGCTLLCNNSGPVGPNSGQVWSYEIPASATPNGVWTNVTPPQTTPGGGAYGFNSVAVDPSHPNVIVVTTLNKYYPAPYDDIFRSTDYGATWFNINTNAIHDVSLAPWVSVFEPGNWFNHFVIDPFDSSHALYGDGETIWATDDLDDADGVATSTGTSVHGNVTHWSLGSSGIEEAAILALASPPGGPAHLVSEMYDLGGFTHTSVDESPTNGQQKSPLFTTGTSIDFAQSKPLIMARVGLSSGTAGTSGQGSGSLHGGYSTDGGVTWSPFASEPSGVTVGAGTVALSADGSTIVWMPSDAGQLAAYSTDNGATWKPSTGGPVQTQSLQVTGGFILVYADRVNPKKFYLFDTTGTNGRTPLYVSIDGGHTYSLTATPTTYDTGFAASPNADGDIWLIGNNGLYHSTNSGTSITQVSGVDNSFGITFGAAAPATTYPAIYLVGHISTDTTCVPSSALGFTVQTQCVYRSTDAGKTFLLINDFAHQYGEFNVIAGDPRVFGRVYFGTNGRGIIQADSPN